MVRMQHDSNQIITQSSKLLHKIVREEGPLGLWTGVGSNIARAMQLSQLCFNYLFLIYKLLRLSSGVFGNFITINRAKTAMQKMKANSQGIMPYTSLVDCLTKIAKQEVFKIKY